MLSADTDISVLLDICGNTGPFLHPDQSVVSEGSENTGRSIAAKAIEKMPVQPMSSLPRISS